MWGQHNRERTVTIYYKICSLGQWENTVCLKKKREMGGGEEVSLRVRQLVSADSRCQWRNLETGVKPGQEQWQSVRRARDTSQETLPFPADG